MHYKIEWNKNKAKILPIKMSGVSIWRSGEICKEGCIEGNKEYGKNWGRVKKTGFQMGNERKMRMEIEANWSRFYFVSEDVWTPYF